MAEALQVDKRIRRIEEKLQQKGYITTSGKNIFVAINVELQHVENYIKSRITFPRLG